MSHAAIQPKASRAGRLAVYLGEMFPPWTYLPYGVALFGVVYLSLQAIYGGGPLVIGLRAWLGAATIVFVLLLMRVYDELKDIEGDIELGRAGDPRYKDRAVVTGKVEKADIQFLRWVVTGIIVALNLAIGYPWPAVGIAVVLFVTWLSFKWFFWPAVSKNLLLAFATHNPLTLFIGAYVIAIYVHEAGAEALDARALLPLGAIWLPLAAWETSRKVRIPADETSYQTYSKILGFSVASLLPLVFVAGATACLLALSQELGVSWIYRGLLIGAAGLCAAACLRLRFAPSTRAARLQPIFELFSVVASIGFVVAVSIEYSLVFTGDLP